MSNNVNTPDHELADEDASLIQYIDVIVTNRWLIASICAFVVLMGTAYAFLARPSYEANVMIQVEEDNPTNATSLLGSVSSLFDVKTQAEGELQILQSRYVVDQAVESLRLYIDAAPRYFPLFGWLLAHHSKSLSNPGILGFGGFCWGTESIDVAEFDVPPDLQDETFKLTLLGNNRFRLQEGDMDEPVEGTVGKLVNVRQSVGAIRLMVTHVDGKPGATYVLKRKSKLKTLNDLQTALKIEQKGKQSDIITATLRGRNPKTTADILNTIGHAYVVQNIKRKASEAEKSAAFLQNALPGLKHNVDEAERRYTAFRNKSGSYDLDLEAQTLLQESVASQSSLLDLQQKRAELATRFTATQPSIVSIDQQITTTQGRLSEIGQRMKRLPDMAQTAVGLMRDIQVATDVYVGALSNLQQLQLVAAGKVGNVRQVDDARVAEEPVSPKKPLVIGLAIIGGLMAGIAVAFARDRLYSGVTDAQDIERYADLSVYGAVPFSVEQKALATSRIARGETHLLAARLPNDPSIESLRSLRTALRFAMLDAPNNRLMLTGPGPGVGKSFVAANLSAVLAGRDRRIVLVDADMRRGMLHQAFGLSRGAGLSNVLAGQAALDDVIHRDVSEGLDFISTGSIPPNASDLLQNESMSRLLEQLSGRYDLVVIDTPPVLAVADAAILAANVAMVFLIARFGKTVIGELKESARQLQRANGTVKGVVFNAVDSRGFGYRSKYGSYRYTAYRYQSEKAT